MTELSYPAELETFWLERASRFLATAEPAAVLDRVRPEVARLSDLFTVARPGAFHRYGDEELARLAYGLFFFPQTYVRTRMVMRECLSGNRWSPPADRPVQVLDLGAGLGAGLLAAAHELAGRPLALSALDHAAGSLEALQALFAQQRLPVETRAGQLLAPLAGSSCWDLILCSFALNEALEDQPDTALPAWARGLLERLHPGGLLVLVEPALDAAAERLEALRDALAAEGTGRIIAPCLHHLPCPLRQEGRVYCHEVRRWRMPDSVAYLNRKLFRDLQVLKFCFLAVLNAGRDALAPDPARVRLVAPVDEQNGKLVTRGCAADGQAHTYEVLNRNLSCGERAALCALERGTRLCWPGPLQRLGDGRTLRASGKPVPEA